MQLDTIFYAKQWEYSTYLPAGRDAINEQIPAFAGMTNSWIPRRVETREG